MGDWQKILDDFSGSSKTTTSTGGKKTVTPAKSNDWQSILDDFSGSTRTTVSPTVTTKKKKKDEEDEGFFDFFKKSSVLDDGFQAKDIIPIILGTAGDAVLNVGKGAASLGEGLVDLGAYGVAGAMDAASRITGGEAGAEYADDIRKKFSENYIDGLLKDEEEYLDKYSVLGRTPEAMAQGLGQIGTVILTGGLAGAAGLSATAATTGTLGLSSMGAGMGEAYQSGATDGEATAYGAISGAADALSELMFGGLGKAFKAAGLSHGAFGLDEALAKKVSGMFSNQLTKNMAEYGVLGLGEGLEEVVAGTAQAIGKKITYMDEKSIGELLKDENLLEQFVVGAVVSGIAQAPSVYRASTNKNAAGEVEAVDYVTGFTQTEQAVIDKEVEKLIAEQEKNGKKLTSKEKQAIAEQVEEGLDKGYISIDTIAEVVENEAYTKYKTDSESEAELRKEYEELYSMKNSEKSNKQIDREAELKAKLESFNPAEARKNLYGMAYERVKTGRLSESFAEDARKTQKFSADVSKYSEKQGAMVQRAIDSGMLNNTNRSHELVDMLAKIEEQKGLTFNFTNNKQMYKEGRLKKGATTNGWVNQKTGEIWLNVDSANSLESVAGHEITHPMKGTEFFKKLQQTAFTHALWRGDYDKRLNAIKELYSKHDPEADVYEELTADLVGDYVFKDKKFIDRLLTEDKGLFKKVSDEISYLFRVATAGSKEARELEKVKRAFEKAYKESGKAQVEGTKHSLSDSETDATYKNAVDSGDMETAQSMVDEAAKKSGYTVKAYHGTGHDFTVFDKSKQGSNYEDWGRLGKGFYFAPDAKEARLWAERSRGNDSKVMAVYLKSENMLDSYGALPDDLKDTIPRDWDGLTKRLAEKYAYNYIEYMQEFGYDVQKILTEKGYDGVMASDTEYVVFDSEQVKSADAITYDNNGEVIPLSKRFNAENPDIRYSFSSIANSFFGNENMSAVAFEEQDYMQTEGYKEFESLMLNNYRQTQGNAYNEGNAKATIQHAVDGIVRVAVAAKKAGYDIADTKAQREAKDSKKRLLFSSLEPNSDYFTSHDISAICDKRQNFGDIYDEIVRQEEAKGVPHGKRFFDNVDNYFAIHKIMADKGLTTPCRQCYVESMRKNLAPMANAFLRLVNETDPDNTANDQLYHQKGKNKGELKTSNASTRELVLSVLEEYGMSSADLTVETLTTEDGLAQLKLQAPLVYEAFNSFYGQSKPKMPKAATPYRFGELTALLTDDKGRIKQSLVDKINATGGFRLQSYSDFQIRNYPDVLQVLFEASTLGLNGHAYTKVPAFLDATANTNLKRNISIFMYKDGDEWKLDRNDSFPYTLEEIYAIVDADKSGNTGIIAVSQNDDMSAWIMANDKVGYGIPYHKSGQKMAVVRDTIVREGGREIKGYSGIKDHTKQQSEVWATTTEDHKALTKVKKGISIYDFWDFDNSAGLSKTELIEKNVKAYIDACEDAGYLPRFRAYVMNNGKVLDKVLEYSKKLGTVSEDATISDIAFEYKGYMIPYGYYKFLGDFGMFTPDGKASPHEALSMENYDFESAVKLFEDSEGLHRTEILQQFANGEEREQYRNSDLTAEELERIVQRKRGEVANEVVNRRYSLSENIGGGSSAAYAPTFYSHMANVIDGVKQEKLGAASVVPMLRGKGVKQEEIKWSGIEAFLEGKKSVTKQELQEFAAGSMLEIEEVERGETKRYTEAQRKRLDELEKEEEYAMDEMWDTWTEEFEDEFPVDQFTANFVERRFRKRINKINEQTGSDITKGQERILQLAALVDRNREEVEEISMQGEGQIAKWGQYKLDGGYNYRELVFKMPDSDYSNQAMEAHWGGEAGVLAHARVQDFDTPDGRMLFIEEIQSDWHNAGHRFGYEDIAETARIEALRKRFDTLQVDVATAYAEYKKVEGDAIAHALNAEMMRSNNERWREEAASYGQRVHETDTAYEELKKELDEVEKELRKYFKKVPDAPFRDNYTDFVMKRLIREAAEKGYNSIGWTTADIQSKRWSYEYAEGYRIEYDQNIPKFLRKYGKKWGATVGKTEMQTKHLSFDEEVDLYVVADILEDGDDYIREKKGIVEVWSMPITDEMWESVLFEGQPMYSLSKDGEQIYGSYRFRGEDVAYVPTAEDLMPKDIEPAPVEYDENGFPIANEDDFAPVGKPVERVENATQHSVSPAEPTQQTKRINAPVKDKPYTQADRLVGLTVDKGMAVENLAYETGNHALQDKYNYMLPSNTRARAQYFMENGDKGVTSLKNIMADVDRAGKRDDFGKYLQHLLNVDRMTLDTRFGGKNKPVFGDHITADISREAVERYEKNNPMFKKWANGIYAINTHLRNMLVEEGILTQEAADRMEEMYPHYVPIVREGLEEEKHPLSRFGVGVNSPIKSATGGNAKIQDIFKSMAQRVEQTYRAAARNSFGLELRNTLGSGGVAQQNDASVDDLIELVDNQDQLLDVGSVSGKPTFTVFENGKRVKFEINEALYDSLKPADRALAYRNKALTTVSGWRRNLITTLNPVFALYRNPVKDLQDLAINSQHPIKTYWNIPRAVMQLARNGEYAQEYHKNGGKGGNFFDSQSNEFTEDGFLKKVYGAITYPSNFIEEIPRLAEYIASRREGRTIERSMLDAARVTTNFAAGGDFTKFLNSHGFTFLNASVQGASQHVRNFREAKAEEGMKGVVKTVAKYIVAGLPAVLCNGLRWEDDEEYEELADYVKDNYYILWKTDDGKFFRVPKGRAIAVTSELMEQMQNLVTGDDVADFNTFYQLFMNNIAPANPMENNILAPIGQALSNKAWYGDDLVPSRLQDLPAEEQYDESTDSISRWLGENFDPLGLGPYKINYLIDQYSGGVGDFFLPMLTPEAESGDNSLKGNLLAPWKKELTTDSVLNNKNPSEFYDLRDELRIKANSSKATEDDAMRSMYMDSVSWDMGDLYAQKREIQNSDMTDAEKYEAVRDLQKQINEIAKTGLSGYNDINVDGMYAEISDRRYNYDAENGKWYEIQPTNSDGSANYWYEREQEVTKGLGITYAEYWNNRAEYEYAYDKPEQYQLARAVGGYEAYKGYTSELWDIKADKDENGKSISGSRKEKVIDYINGLDADYGMKIILFKNEYNSDDTYNEEIIEYLNSRDDISYEQMETILKHLGFEVSDDGYVSWD